ncbi:MAG: nitroreductase family protein [Bacteroidales bacterium]|jgi:ferredoxin|nr:nitroreductase family protein [Bacteroidales bacterium]
MDISITVDDKKCIKCGRCITVCPADIFLRADPSGKIIRKEDFKAAGDVSGYPIAVYKPQRCIACGHCVDVCPTSSVIHSVFPPERVHKIDYSRMPSPESVMMLMKARRSNRSFTAEPVPGDMVDKILESAYLAPTAENKQQLRFIMVTSPEKIMAMRNFVLDVFGSKVRIIDSPLLRPVMKIFFGGLYKYVKVYYRMKRLHDAGRDMILRGATAVLFVAAPEERFESENANLAIENASLMAASLGLGQIYTGFLCTAIRMDEKKFGRLLGLPEGMKIYGGLGFGMSSVRFLNYADRKDLDAKRI